MATLHIFTWVFIFTIRSRFTKSKPFPKIICNRYGNYTLKFSRKFEKLSFRWRKISDNIIFLNSCLENDLCPTFLRFKASPEWLQDSESYKQSRRMFLQEEITLKMVKKERIIRKIHNIKDNLRCYKLYWLVLLF